LARISRYGTTRTCPPAYGTVRAPRYLRRITGVDGQQRSYTGAILLCKDNATSPEVVAGRREKHPMPLLNVDQAAERLGTSPRFIRRLIAERRIPYAKLGKHVRIDTADLEAFVAAARVEPGTRLARDAGGSSSQHAVEDGEQQAVIHDLANQPAPAGRRE
jgi:excisionase family DNA binding protein